MNKTKLLISSVVVSATFLAAATAFAGFWEDRGVSEARPFFQLIKRVDNMENQIDDLVGIVESIEGRVTGLEGAVTELQADTDAINVQIEGLALNMEANEAEIIELGQKIVQNANMIAMMQDSIRRIENELAKKQSIISGTCIEGTVLSEIRADGSVVCVSQMSGLRKFSVNQFVNVPAGEYIEEQCNNSWYSTNCVNYRLIAPETRTVTAACPEGAIMLHGSSEYNALTLESEGEVPLNAWTARATNYSFSEHTLFASAVCVAVE